MTPVETSRYFILVILKAKKTLLSFCPPALLRLNSKVRAFFLMLNVLKLI